MSWLKKFGQAALKAVGVVSGFAPLINQVLPDKAVKPFNDVFGRIAAAVQVAEVVVGAIQGPDAKGGADKLKAVAALTRQIIQASELVAGKEIADEVLFGVGSEKIASGVADILNSLKGDVIVTPTKELLL